MSRLIDQLRLHTEQTPDRVAVIRDGGAAGCTTATYGELNHAVLQFTRAYQMHAPGAAFVPLYTSKSIEAVAAVLAALAVGKAFICLNRKLRWSQLQHIFSATSSRLVLIDGGGLLTISREADASRSLGGITTWALRDHAWSRPHAKAAATLRDIMSLCVWPDDFSTDDQNISPELIHDDRRPGCCLFTSGSTGAPKGVLVSARDLDDRAEAEVGCFGLRSDDVLLNVLPWSFDVGLNQLLSSIWCGATLVLTESWLPADLLRMAAAHRVTGISGVPAVWKDMINAGMAFDTDGPHGSLRYLTVSGGDLSGAHLDQLAAMAPGVGIFKTYGQTEAFRATVLRPEFLQSKPQSCGRPFTNVRVYVVRDDGTLADPHETGEVVHTGLGSMLGYLEGDGTEKLRPNPFQGVGDPVECAVFTGDRGHLDEDGFLYLSGRSDGMLKVMGNRVYPEEVSAALVQLNGVGDAEVVGVKDEDGMATLVAFVTERHGGTLPDGGIQRQLAARLPSYMVPQLVIVLAAMPRTSTGKPDRPALLALAAAKLAEEASGGGRLTRPV